MRYILIYYPKKKKLNNICAKMREREGTVYHSTKLLSKRL